MTTRCLREKPEQVLANAQDFAQLTVVLRRAADHLNLLAAVVTTAVNTTWLPEAGDAGDQEMLVTIRSIPATPPDGAACTSFDAADVLDAFTAFTV